MTLQIVSGAAGTAASPPARRRNPRVEQRYFVRFPLKIPARIDFPNRPSAHGLTRELSLGNAFIATRDPIPQHDIISLQLVDGGAPVPVSGIITRRLDEGVAIEFLDLGVDISEAIEDLLSRHL